MNQGQSATNILQASTAIAIALATLTQGSGPSVGPLEIFTTTLMLGGFTAIVSSLYAMGDVVIGRDNDLTPALGLLALALWIVGISYIIILYDMVNW